jgi:hypothetical protein
MWISQRSDFLHPLLLFNDTQAGRPATRLATEIQPEDFSEALGSNNDGVSTEPISKPVTHRV